MTTAEGPAGPDGADGHPSSDGADGQPSSDGADGQPSSEGADGHPSPDGADEADGPTSDEAASAPRIGADSGRTRSSSAIPAAPGRLLIAVNDLLVYRAATTQPTGMRRLVEGYARHLPAVAGTLGIDVRLVVVSGDVVREPAEDVTSARRSRLARVAELALRASAHAPRGLQERARTTGRRILARRAGSGGAPLHVGPGDTLLILGAPWIATGMAAGAVAVKARSGVRLAQLVHDMLPITGARWYGDAQGLAAAADLRALLAAADALAAVSPEVAAQAADVAGRSVTPVPPPDPDLPAPADPRGLRPATPYVLTVGTIHPRKNHVLLLDAWSRWLASTGADGAVGADGAEEGASGGEAEAASAAGAAASDAPCVPDLVIAGRRHPQDGPVFQRLASDATLRAHVRVVTDATDAELAALYAGCRFLAFPSFAEGWGLPIREALRFGKPSIISDAIPSTDVARFVEIVPTGDGDALYAAIRRWWADPNEVASRERVIREEFVPRDWDQACRELLAAVMPRDGA